MTIELIIEDYEYIIPKDTNPDEWMTGTKLNIMGNEAIIDTKPGTKNAIHILERLDDKIISYTIKRSGESESRRYKLNLNSLVVFDPENNNLIWKEVYLSLDEFLRAEYEN